MASTNNRARDGLPRIRVLDDASINRIAAGEVIERPASVVKELVENSIDAGSSRIEITYSQGGKSLIRVEDNGCGIAEEDLTLAVARHATSKIDGTDLLDISTFGFRGEALPSMGAAGELSIVTRARGSACAHSITVDRGSNSRIRPAARAEGTVIEVLNLFKATPARLKFLRSDRAEVRMISDVVKNLAMSEPSVGFVLHERSPSGSSRTALRLAAENGDFHEGALARLGRIIGSEFTGSAIPIDTKREDYRLVGYCSLPTFSRGSSNSQFMFVNGRPVKDRVLHGALRAAYSDFIPKDRYPVVALFLECPFQLVDVNVHPSKAEVRFREPGVVRGLIIAALRAAIANAGHQASPVVSKGMLEAFKPETIPFGVTSGRRGGHGPRVSTKPVDSKPDFRGALGELPPWTQIETDTALEKELVGNPLGVAKAQIHKNYIIAQTNEGIAIIDQHAAHERLVYEKFKKQLVESGIETQSLLSPIVVELDEDQRSRLLEISDRLTSLGLVVEGFGPGAVCVREVPAILGAVDCEKLIENILIGLEETGETLALEEQINEVLSRMSCHGSIRSGRRMSAEEMNELLREMERTPHSGQCNHGRPTYVKLALGDIERLFGRK